MPYYLVNNVQGSKQSDVTMAYADLSKAVDAVMTIILDNEFFKSLSLAERKNAALEWIVQVDVK